MRFISLLLLVGCLLFSGFATAEEEKEEKKPNAYLSLTPSLIANVHGKARYARLDVQLLSDEESLYDLKLHSSAIRHELLLLMADQKGEDLKSPKGKERFRQEALAAVSKVVKEQTGKNSVKDLFFTSFFVQ